MHDLDRQLLVTSWGYSDYYGLRAKIGEVSVVVDEYNDLTEKGLGKIKAAITSEGKTNDIKFSVDYIKLLVSAKLFWEAARKKG